MQPKDLVSLTMVNTKTMVQPMIISHMNFACLMENDRASMQDLVTQTAFGISMVGSNSMMAKLVD
jgi:hypothetical protein